MVERAQIGVRPMYRSATGRQTRASCQLVVALDGVRRDPGHGCQGAGTENGIHAELHSPPFGVVYARDVAMESRMVRVCDACGVEVDGDARRLDRRAGSATREEKHPLTPRPNPALPLRC